MTNRIVHSKKHELKLGRSGMYVLVIVLSCLPACARGEPTVIFQQGDASTASDQIREWTFDTGTTLPEDAEVYSGEWIIRATSDAPSSPNALCQVATAEFPALRLGEAIYTDVSLSTSFKPISGRTDQAAGLLLRIQDANNYYIARANALENNVNLYVYVNGRRSQIGSGKAEVPSGQWQTLTMEAEGTALRGYLNDQLVVEVTDTTFAAGQIGIWTKADSETCFDDVRVESR